MNATHIAHSTRSPDPALLVTAEDVASSVGISKRSVYELAARGEIPAVRLGRCIRFDARAVAEKLAGAAA